MGSESTVIIHPSIHTYIHLYVKTHIHSLKLAFLTFLSCFRLGQSFSVFLQLPKRRFETLKFLNPSLLTFWLAFSLGLCLPLLLGAVFRTGA